MLNVSTDNLWRVVSRGYAAHNLDLDDVWLEVFCPEITGFVDGEITDYEQVLTTNGKDFTNNHYSSSIATTNTIRTKWKQGGTNRITPPNIRRGERVEVWQYADADAYYWSTTGEDDNLRRLETVTYAYSNTKDENTKEINKDNSYYVTISTHQKKIEIGTSKSDGEPYAHTLQLDTKRGLFTYTDDVGNLIQVNSKDNQIYIENADGSKITMDKGNVTFDAPSSMTINTPNFKLNGDNVNISGSNMNVQANVSTKGNLTNNGKNVGSNHTHKGVSPGKSSTGTPN